MIWLHCIIVFLDIATPKISPLPGFLFFGSVVCYKKIPLFSGVMSHHGKLHDKQLHWIQRSKCIEIRPIGPSAVPGHISIDSANWSAALWGGGGTSWGVRSGTRSQRPRHPGSGCDCTSTASPARTVAATHRGRLLSYLTLHTILYPFYANRHNKTIWQCVCY